MYILGDEWRSAEAAILCGSIFSQSPTGRAAAETEPFSSSLHDCPTELSFKTFKSLPNNCLGGKA